jgi:hypothetical protein
MVRFTLKSERFSPEGSISGAAIRRNLGRSSLDPLSILIREAVQNSWDARLDRGGGSIVFAAHLKTLDWREIGVLKDSVFAVKPESHPMTDVLKEGLGILILRDTGTTGLNGPVFHVARSGPQDDRNRNFIRFVRDIGRGATTERGGGTYGFGKSSHFNASGLGTVLVYTRVLEEGDRLESRLIAMSLSNPSEDEKFTGRHWWGVCSEDGVAPLCGDQADLLAKSIGLTPFQGGETGTSVGILAPRFVAPFLRIDHETAKVVAETMTAWFWPRMLTSPSGQPWIRFVVTLEGRHVPVPRPDDTEPFRTMAMGLRSIQGVPHEGVDLVEVFSERPKASLGKLAVSRLATRHQPAVWGALQVDGHCLVQLLDTADGGLKRCHHVALMRSTWQVVRYLPCRAIKARGHGLGAVFLVNDSPEVEEAFAQSEPPAHDDWLPDSLDDEFQKRYVRIALRKIREAADRVAETIESLQTVTGPGLAHLSADLGNFFLEPLGSLKPRTGRLPFSKQPVAGSIDVAIDGEGRLEWVGGEKFMVLGFRVPRSDDESRREVKAQGRILIVGGGAEPMTDSSNAMLRVVGWRRRGSDALHKADSLVLSGESPLDWELVMRIPSDAQVSVGLICRRLQS